MTTTLWLGISANGMIADKNGEEDFLSEETGELFVQQVQKSGCVIMGKTAYLRISKNLPKHTSALMGVDKVYLSRAPHKTTDGWLSAQSPREAIELLASRGHKDITVTGGTKTATSFLALSLIDEVTLVMNPVIISPGYPICSDEKLLQELVPSGVQRKLNLIVVKYMVVKPR